MVRFNLSALSARIFHSTAAVAAIACVSAVAAPQANAFSLQNGWNYAVDSHNDGISGGRLGGAYEIYGMGIKQVGSEVIVGLDSRLPAGGEAGSYVEWGDLFFNFGGGTMSEGSGDFFAVRFAEDNDAGVSELGVFANATGQFVDNGFNSVAAHTNYVAKKGGSASVGDLAANDSYFDASYNVLGGGTKVGDITMLDATALTEYGFDLNHDPASVGPTESATYGATRESFGFKFELPPGMVGQFVAHIAEECFNDSVALVGELKAPGGVDVPEPGMMLGLAGVAALGLVRRRRSSIA